MVPLRDAALLSDNYAQFCVNAYLYKGTLRGFAETTAIYKLKDSAAKRVYRIPSDAEVQQNFSSSFWFEFEDIYLTALRAPMIEDKFQRYYFFPSTGGAYFNTLDNLKKIAPLTGVPGSGSGADGWLLGVPAPEVVPTVSAPTGQDEARAYVYTWQNQFSEEGPPSPPTVVTGPSLGAWEIGVTPPTADDSLDRALTTTNIYRTVTGASGAATFYRVGSIPIGQTAFSDTLTDAQAANSLLLPSASWNGPPADLQGVVQLANGIMAGWSNKKEIWFSEAYTPHSWPAGYSVSVPYPIVGLAAVGSALTILTEGPPQIAIGNTPGTMSLGAIMANEPCISRGSIVAAGEGVYYASPNGLILVNTSGTQNATQNILQKEEWIKSNPYAHAGGKYSMAYVALIKGDASNKNGLIIDHQAYSLATLMPANLNTPFSWLDLPAPVVNVYNDELSGQLFFIAGGTLYQWNPETVTARFPYIWRSKDFKFPFAQQFAAGSVQFDLPPVGSYPAVTSKSRNTDQNQTYDPTKQLLLLRVFADGRQILVREIQEAGELIKLPSGFKAVYWSFQFEGIVDVRFAQFATSVKELRKV